jgi:hypothetical protein
MFLIPAAFLSFRGASDEVGGSQVTGYRGLGTWGPGPSFGATVAWRIAGGA